MGLQTLPVYEALTSHGRYLDFTQERGWFENQFDRNARATLASEVKCVLNEYPVPDPAREAKNGAINLEKSLGHTALPFPMMWVEWSVPRGVITDAKNYDGHVGALLTSGSVVTAAHQRSVERGDIAADTKTVWSECVEGTSLERSWQCQPYLMTTDMPVAIPGMLAVALDANGMYLATHCTADMKGAFGDIVRRPKGIESEADYLDPNDQEGTTALVARICWGAVMAIAWMNCKNVQTPEHTILARSQVPARGKRKSRTAFKTVDYHTILLPSGAPGGGGSGGSTGGGTRMHTVRGHFKTFTKERPLLGRATGTYWWGWQVRGNAEHGVTVTDYDMKARKR